MEKFKENKTEQEPKVTSRVILEFMRHGKKEGNPNKLNEELLLTEEGRAQAIAKGEELDPQAEVSVAWGSPRARSRETAALVMLANEGIDPNADLPSIEAAIDEELNKDGGNKRKIIEDSRLDFNFTGPGIGKWSAELYGGDNPFLATYIKESDQRALDTGDTVNDTYTRKAADIAEIILRYIKVGDTFNRIVSDTDKYAENGNQLERYLGTHGTVVEPLVAKLLEKLNGLEARDEFAEAVGNDFPEATGISVEIINHGDEQEIKIRYNINGHTEELDVTIDLLEEILKERDEFEKKFN